MKVGDVIENAIWITGDEPEGLRKKYERDVRESIDELCDDLGFFHGPVVFKELRPEDDRVPEVPDHIQGQKVRLLHAEAEVIKKKPVSIEGSFVENLDKKDLQRLRVITRKKYAKETGKIIGNKKCDEIIEELGPQAAVAALRLH